MNFSCKITNSIISYLIENGDDANFLFDSLSLHEEFLRDPSMWIKSSDAERILELCLEKLLFKSKDYNVLSEIGHLSKELRCWGVLDSVLKIMINPHEVFLNPERFLSYFIYPAPPIENIVRLNNRVEFDLPISSEDYPLVTTYLKAAFESLPTYVSRSPAICCWDKFHISFDWNTSQNNIFSIDDIDHKISPIVIDEVQAELYRLQKIVDNNNISSSYVFQNNNLNSNFNKQGILSSSNYISDELKKIDIDSIEKIFNNLSILNDYMTRAQQLIILLVGQDRLNTQVQQAMKKVDWETVKLNYPKVIKHTSELLRPKE